MIACNFQGCLVLASAFQVIHANQGQRVGVTGSLSCTPLQPVNHGTYVCTPTTQLKCELKCAPGYLVPITQVGQNQARLPLKERGVYKCEDQAGSKVWSPPLLFDCVEAKYPTDITMYFAVTINSKTSSGTCDDKDLGFQNELNEILTTVVSRVNCENLNCRTLNYTVCDDKKRLIDVELLMDLTDEEDYTPIQVKALAELTNQLKLKYAGVKIASNTIVNCEKGTLLQRDLTCRGCSKGYFLDGMDMLCKQCPSGYYQDQNHQMNCKPCPPGASKDLTGLQGISDCFHVDSFTKKTSIVTILSVVFSIALVATVLLYYRSQVILEPDGKTREYYPEPIRLKMEAYTMVPEVGSETLKVSFAQSGDGDKTSPRVPNKTLKVDGTEIPNRLKDARMSVAGLAAARLTGAFSPVPKKTKSTSANRDAQKARTSMDWHPIKQRASVAYPRNPKDEIADLIKLDDSGLLREDESHGEGKGYIRFGSLVDKELQDSTSSLYMRKGAKSPTRSTWKVTGPKD